MTRFGKGLLATVMVLGLFGCDYFAQKDLKPGVSTEEEVRRRMGNPNAIWEEGDGSQTYEYARGPAGHETYMVVIGPDRIFRSMRNVLTEETFSKVRPGMNSSEVQRLLGRPTDQTVFKLKNEEVWSWRYYTAPPQRSEMFNVHFDPDRRVAHTSRSADPRTEKAQ